MNISQKDLSFFKRLLLFPLILFICGFFSTINKIYLVIENNNNEIKWLAVLDYFFFSIYGFLNALVIFFLK